MSFSSDTKRELSALKPNGASEDALSLRRLFLEKGTMTNPARDYHMEFACASLEAVSYTHLGLVLAFLVNGLYEFFRQKVFRRLGEKKNGCLLYTSLIKLISIIQGALQRAAGK